MIIKLKLLKNKKGSILFFNIILITVVLIFVVGITKINKESLKLMNMQTRQDAHALSIISFYVYTLNEISWANNKLKTLGFISFVLSKIPVLKEFGFFVDLVIKGLKMYQDFLLWDLSVRSKIIDVELRIKNKIKKLPNIHYLNSRRQSSKILFDAELIEIKQSVFETACIVHKNPVSSNKTCVYSDKYFENKSQWLAPTEELWSLKFYDL